MKKRTFLKISTIAATGLAFNPFYACQTAGDKHTEAIVAETSNFTLPKLNYPVDALAPHIDKMTMEIHHGKHHAGYVKKLNKAIADTTYAKMPLLDIVSNVKATDTAVRNNGGGHFNHSLFWNCIAPNAGGEPKGELAKAIKDAFGSFDQFKELFSLAAKTRFGSGWAWLSVDTAGKLFISSTANQDNPLMKNIVKENGTPILGIDVWEHAYYLNYQNKRTAYIESFFEIINWKSIEDSFTESII